MSRLSANDIINYYNNYYDYNNYIFYDNLIQRYTQNIQNVQNTENKNKIYLFITSMSTGYYPQHEVLLEHFKENYYSSATFKHHYEYLIILQKFRADTGRFPTKKEFFKNFYRECYCEYTYTLDEFVTACTIYMKYCGDISKLTCVEIYFLSQFIMIEHREPSSFEEFAGFLGRVVRSMRNPDSFFENDVILRPVENKKLEDIKKTISELKDTEDCSLCQEDIKLGEKCVRLDCGHFFHSETKNCCETGTIFKWFETHRTCPTCRKEMI
jgi:hypothetical protein